MSNPTVAEIIDAASYVKSSDLDTEIQLPAPGAFLRDFATLTPGTDYTDDEPHRQLADAINEAPRRKGSGSNGGEWAQLVLTYEQAGLLHDLTVVRRAAFDDLGYRAYQKVKAADRAYQTVTNRLTKRGVISAHRASLLAERVPYATRWTALLTDTDDEIIRVYEDQGTQALAAFMDRIDAASYRHLPYALLTPAERAHIHKLKHLF
ncbi:hypothetical protein ACWDTQ_23100 [Streptomyces cellulosae]